MERHEDQLGKKEPLPPPPGPEDDEVGRQDPEDAVNQDIVVVKLSEPCKTRLDRPILKFLEF